MAQWRRDVKASEARRFHGSASTTTVCIPRLGPGLGMQSSSVRNHAVAAASACGGRRGDGGGSAVVVLFVYKALNQVSGWLAEAADRARRRAA